MTNDDTKSLGAIFGEAMEALAKDKKADPQKYCLIDFQQRYNTARLNLIHQGHYDFVTLSETLYKEFKEAAGIVTCEHFTRGSDLDVKMEFLALMTFKENRSLGFWRIYWCDTCHDHSRDHPFHCELILNS